MTWLSGASGGDAQARTRTEAAAVLVLVDVAAAADDPPAAAAFLLPHEDGTVELSVVHAPGSQETELTRRLLAEVCDALRHGDVARVVVDPANRRLPPPAVLAEAGFRPSTREGDDWLELDL